MHKNVNEKRFSFTFLENMHKNVNEHMFSFTFLCIFHASVIFVQIFMNFSPKCRTKKLGIMYIIFGKILFTFELGKCNYSAQNGA